MKFAVVLESSGAELKRQVITLEGSAEDNMNRTLLDECFRVQGRQTWYIDVRKFAHAERFHQR